MKSNNTGFEYCCLKMLKMVLPLGPIRSFFLTGICVFLVVLLTGWTSSGYSMFAAVVLVFAATFTLDFLIRDISSSHTWRSALDQYLALNVLDQLGWIFHWKMMKDTKNIVRVQMEVLMDFLHSNAETEYGIQHNFSNIKSRDDFIHAHPLTTYSDVEPYINRMVEGEENVLTRDRPKIFAVTSGTSGKTSILPFLRKQQKIFFLRGITVMSYRMMLTFFDTKFLRKSVKFFYSPRWRQSVGGIPIGPNSSSPASTKSILHLYTTPAVGYEITTEPEALYVHLLFCLKDRDLGMMEANFSSAILNAFQFLQANWRDLVPDIEQGRIKAKLNIPEHVRSELNFLLKPDKERAENLQKEFEKGWDGIAKRIWPKLNLILCVDSGSFTVYSAALYKYCIGIPTYSPIYAATEGLIGLNIWPGASKSYYLLVPRAMFFEFIRLENVDEIQPRTLFIDQVKLNEIFELVLTNASGLFRYRFGDVIRIVDFVNQCPVVEFLFRKGQLLNVRGEKLSENVVCKALETAILSVSPQFDLIDYTTCENVTMEATINSGSYKAPHYGIFLELIGDAQLSLEFIDHLQREIDHQLKEQSYVFQSYRLNESIGMPELFLCKPGTFAAFRQFLLISTESSSNQVKIPRVIRKSEQVKFLLNYCLNRNS